MSRTGLRNSLLILGAGLLIGVGLGVAILLGLGYANDLTGTSARQALSGLAVGDQAPDFELANLAGDVLRLSELRGNPVVINFWATWCAPCVLEMPNIQKFYDQFSGEFYVLAVNAGEPARDVESFVTDIGLTFDILLDADNKLPGVYSLRGYPTTFFVDREGVIRAVHIGLMTEDQIAGYLVALGVGN